MQWYCWLGVAYAVCGAVVGGGVALTELDRNPAVTGLLSGLGWPYVLWRWLG